MKQVVQSYRSGELRVEEVPVPSVSKGQVLVRNHFSVISAGTERAMIELARKSLVGKAKDRPDLVRKVLDKARADGVVAALEQALRRLDAPKPLGYSSAGVVLETGAGVEGIRPGDRVACAGAGYASHAEVISVPRNLCVPVPGGADLRDAAFSTLGAVAMQGVRVSGAGLGERVAVIGLGLIGQITVQLLKSAGCRVFGIDLEDWKLDLARQLGAEGVGLRNGGDLEARVLEFTAGHGADAVVVTAATTSPDPLKLAGEIARDRATIAVVGVVSIDVPHKLYYEKELRVLMSRSYGPGRYDRQYEECGQDYPIGYVRWTENRNMEAFVELLARGQVSVGPLVTQEFSIEEAALAYDLVTGKAGGRTLGILLSYAQAGPLLRRVGLPGGRHPRRAVAEEVGVGVIGAGQFATGTLLPLVRRVGGIHLRGLATGGGVSARKVGDKYGFAYCTTDYREVLADPDVHAVLVLTRNSQHAAMAGEALEAGKAVLVEKPLATNPEELERLSEIWRETGGHLMVGFNRRYAPFSEKLKAFSREVRTPAVGLYRVNAGSLLPDAWLYDEEEGGGRLIAEVCHFIDFLQFVFESRPVEVSATAIGGGSRDHRNRENVVLTLGFEDGSVGSVAYLSSGDKSFSKERVEVFRGGGVAVIEDFRRLTLTRGGRRKTLTSKISQDKGHRGELEVFFRSVRAGQSSPEAFRSYALVTLATFAAERSLESGKPVDIDLASVGLDG